MGLQLIRAADGDDLTLLNSNGSVLYQADIQHGRVLKISNLVTANLYDSAGIMDKMINSMIDKARDSDCVAVQVALPEETGRGPQPLEGTVSLLRDAGYRLASVALSKPIEKK